MQHFALTRIFHVLILLLFTYTLHPFSSKTLPHIITPPLTLPIVCCKMLKFSIEVVIIDIS